uniref:Uncharacterized protein n=1 Tax=Panagrellus redivivus TaxID=6233 RepID=A0A7E4WC00_PANRE
MLNRVFGFFCIVIVILAVVVQAQFNIPLPFGGLTFNKKPNGQIEIQTQQDVDILGYGGSRGFNITAGNGTFMTESEGGILANGTKYGTNSTIGGSNKGIVADSDLNVGNKTVKGGLGKESSFIGGLADLFKGWGRRH